MFSDLTTLESGFRTHAPKAALLVFSVRPPRDPTSAPIQPHPPDPCFFLLSPARQHRPGSHHADQAGFRLTEIQLPLSHHHPSSTSSLHTHPDTFQKTSRLSKMEKLCVSSRGPSWTGPAFLSDLIHTPSQSLGCGQVECLDVRQYPGFFPPPCLSPGPFLQCYPCRE